MPRTAKFKPEMIDTAWGAARGSSKSARLRAAAAALGCTVATVQRHLKGRTGSASSHSNTGPSPIGERKPLLLSIMHPAIVEARTLFPTTVRDVGDEWLLKGGDNSAKIGREVRKGPWKGFPIYTLTLEERATCPTSCAVYGSCYGNHMTFARRWRHGAALEWRLEREVPALELKHPRGFVVRLHSLGDFYSVEYVRLWRRLLESCTALRVFGYTARIDTMADEVAYEVALLVRDYWTRLDVPRFAVRFSNAPIFARSTTTIETPIQRPADAVICPAQYVSTPAAKKAECCAQCALCWDTDRRIAFLRH